MNFFFSSRRRHTRSKRDWSSDVCSPICVGAGDVIAGIRPEAFEDAAFAPGDLPQIDVHVEVLESIGSDAYVFFRVDAEPLKLAVDPSRVYYFSPQTGESLLGRSLLAA